MGLQPIINRKAKFTLKKCSRCGQSFGPENFAPTKSIFYTDGVIPICNDCVEDILAKEGNSWEIVDKICQMADIPFVPKEWEKLREMSDKDVFYRYASIFLQTEYDNIGWGEYFEAFKSLKAASAIETELPLIADDQRTKLKEKWGANYDDEALNYLENLFAGLVSTQNVNGALQVDQAIKICKMSYEIDRRIAEGSDFDKLLSSYDKLVKAAEFTPKNAKNINDFDTFGEAVRWLEKRGWRNQFYDNVTRDVVDETIKNMQMYNQRLYINESGISEEVNRRIEQLKSVAEAEIRADNYYETEQQGFDADRYENDGYESLMKNNLDEDFAVDLDGDGDDEE